MIANHDLRLELNPDFSFSLFDRSARLAVGRVSLALASATCFAGKADSLQVQPTVELESDLGCGQRLSATVTWGNLAGRLMVDWYAQWPDAFVLQWEFENVSGHSLPIDRLVLPEICLDESLGQDLWSMQGVAVQWGQDFAMPLAQGFSRDNYLGHTDLGEGGGIPVVYCWNRDRGLALAHIEPYQALWYLPVQADTREGTRMTLEDRREVLLAPGEKVQSLRVLVSLHHGDFFEPLNLYRQVMQKQGLAFPQANEEDFQPAWCSWGYEFDVRPEEVIGVLPELEEMGIRWLTLDDRWFDHYGDWNPRSDTFPGGEAQMKAMTAKIHDRNAFAQLWWYPLCVEDGGGHWETYQYGTSAVLEAHPDWLLLNTDGSVARNNRGLAILCPGLPEVRAYTANLTRRFVEEWGFDGHKLDNIYTVPACHNPAHHHARPEESVEGFAEAYRLIFETTRQIKPDSVTQICPCGTPITHTLIPWMDQAVTADPTSSAQIRQRIKFYKGLLGPHSPIFADHVELSDQGSDFASELGAGGIMATKFIWPADEDLRTRLENWPVLSAEKEASWRRWFNLYSQHPLAKGEYLNLYDLGYDRPETHLIRYDGRLYYAFFTGTLDQSFLGKVVLRGLEPGREYRLYDYVEEKPLGAVTGPEAAIELAFCGYRLLWAEPSDLA